jgi:hypothetical protein
MPHRYSTVAHFDLAAIRPRPPDLNGHPTLRLWLPEVLAGLADPFHAVAPHRRRGPGCPAARRAAAEGLRLAALDPDHTDPAPVLKSRWRSGPADRGADVGFQCRGRTAALGRARA